MMSLLKKSLKIRKG